MEPRPFVRLMVESLAIKTKPSSTNNPSTTPYFCKINMKYFPSQTVILPLNSSSCDTTPEFTTSAPSFHLDSSAIRRLSANPVTLRISIYTSSMERVCGFASAKLLGRVTITINDLANSVSRCNTFHKGWLHVGKNKIGNEADKGSAMIHLVVRSEPDPRFVFEFGGEPECSPVVYQIQENNIRQPVFSCKFRAHRLVHSTIHFRLYLFH
ncbi:putative C2 domain-containing protein [Lupinus albus]|uniref:Putative C2 domain-containing protein n=1 Tax=Lupinus albus TaxID=3870 RepID=A0A6A4PGL8_LUPAL|nr:putative C2 domain-containing protein [Lupinus albus]